MEKKVDKVLPGKMFILTSFKEKVFTHINSQQKWMNFNTFSSSSHVDCAIQITFNLQSIKHGSCYIVNNVNPSYFILGKRHVIRVNVI